MPRVPDFDDDTTPREPVAAGGESSPPAPTSPLLEAAKAVSAHFSDRQSIPPQNEIITRATTTYLNLLDADDVPVSHMIESQLLGLVNSVVSSQNAAKAKTATEKLPLMRCLTSWQIAQVMLRLHKVRLIAPRGHGAGQDPRADRDRELLAMYQIAGADEGTYTASETDMRAMARQYNAQLTRKEYKEVEAVLREDAPRTHQCTDRDLVAVNNGVFFYGCDDRDVTIGGKTFHFTAKSLHPFDPALVFLAKSRVPYVEDPVNPVYTNPDGTQWDVVSWVADLSDDQGVPELLWEIIGAVIRPHVSWNKTAWLYSERGNNGKGTLCALMRNLCGPGVACSIPLAEFARDFALTPLLSSNVIIVDENDVDDFVDKAANFKAVVTGDVIQVNRKYNDPVALQFNGFMVQ